MASRFEPKLLTALREGYGPAQLRVDAIAGLTVGIVALPLAMALAIASGAAPETGLLTAVVAGFLISALGGSRVQIGGPTGAFVVVIHGVIAAHGFDGLLVATLMAGLILIVAALAGLGQIIRYIPHPVVTGFTAGIAVIIASSQVKDFLGLDIPRMPAEFVPEWQAILDALDTIDPATAMVGLGALAIILGLRRIAPRAPGFLIAVAAGAAAVALFDLPIETVGSRFPDMKVGLPAPSIPAIDLARLQALLPSAFTIAFLAGIEALLSAMVADGMTGSRHRPDQELLAQGLANVASAGLGGLPATGAIARTATNIRAGGQTPVAGMIHALFVGLAAFAAADLLALVPMAALAAILFIVAWGMSEVDRFRALLSMPNGERALLVLTFLLTVLVDLTVAIAVGVTLASLLFVARMAEAVEMGTGHALPDEAAEEPDQRSHLPAHVEVFRLAGPLFFGVAGELLDSLRRIGQRPRVIILRMRLVPYLDASAAAALADFAAICGRQDCALILSGVRPSPRDMLGRAGLREEPGRIEFAADFAAALTRSEALARSTAA